MKLNVSLLVHKEVIHVGHMKAEDKSETSHEGKCLSVSQCPDSWVRIAKLGGRPWHKLKKADAKFIDYHKLIEKKDNKQALYQWGIQRGLILPQTVYRAKWYDDEFEQHFQSIHATREEAEEEANEIGTVKAMKNYPVLTDKALAAAGYVASDRFIHNHDALALLLAEEQNVDGVWWDDDDDPDRLSAPRGGILPGKLPTWKVKLID